MVRAWVLGLVSVLPFAERIARGTTDPEQQEDAYVIELGVVTYGRCLSNKAIKAFEADLKERGEKVPARYVDLETLAYRQEAQEMGRVSLTFLLRVGDQSRQKITMPDSSVFAQISLLSADDSNLAASISFRCAGKVISRHGRASMGSSSRSTRIPLDDREHYTESGGSFALFPGDGGQEETRRRYVRARLATPEDFEHEKMDRHLQLPPGIVAGLDANPPRFLALDEHWQWLRLVTPSEYDDYATVDKLEEVLKNKLIQETERVQRICSLREGQAEKLEAALLRRRTQVLRDAFALEEEALRNPRLQGPEELEFRRRLAAINELLHQSYFTEGSLTDAILRSHLEEEQLEELERVTLDEFINGLAGSELNWDEGQATRIRKHLQGFVDKQNEVVLDHQQLLDALTAEFLPQVLDDWQVEYFERMRRVSPKAHNFLLNVIR